MKIYNEAGVLPQSRRFFSTPSATAKRLFFYVTRCGHYFYDASYCFADSCSVARLKSHQNFFLICLLSGRMQFQLPHGVFTAEAGQLALINCRAPHRFFTGGSAEALWLHFDGANAAAFFEQILLFREGRQVLDALPGNPVREEMAAIIQGLSRASLTEVECSQRLYRILCALLLPQQAVCGDSGPAARAVQYIARHLFEPLSVPQVAAAVNLSPSHFSRLFRSSTGFSPHEYIVLRRVDEAKRLLHTTALSVKEIADRTGYRSEGNFIASFTEKVGLSPTAFRRGI